MREPGFEPEEGSHPVIVGENEAGLRVRPVPNDPYPVPILVEEMEIRPPGASHNIKRIIEVLDKLMIDSNPDRLTAKEM